MTNPEIIIHSPGRINIIGEHTDYNQGYVLPAAIDKKTTLKLKKNGTVHTCNMVASNLNEIYTFDLSTYEPLKSGWQNYVMGVVSEIQKLGAQITGFDCEFEGTVPIGSGMSSSASLECGLATGLNALFDLGLDQWQIIKASQMAEHNFVGIKCGIMDQFASVMGKKDHVMLLDCRSLAYQYFPFDLGEYQLLLINTNVTHTLASSEYNTRRVECEQGVEILKNKIPSIQTLRDVTLENLSNYKSILPEKVYLRCEHVINENQRVLDATQALLDHDFDLLGQLMYQSHASLQHKYDVSCKELDFLIEKTKNKDYILGARMMGGGFGGCTINIIKKTEVDNFIDAIGTSYQQQFGIACTPYTVNIADGARVSDNNKNQ